MDRLPQPSCPAASVPRPSPPRALRPRCLGRRRAGRPPAVLPHPRRGHVGHRPVPPRPGAHQRRCRRQPGAPTPRSKAGGICASVSVSSSPVRARMGCARGLGWSGTWCVRVSSKFAFLPPLNMGTSDSSLLSPTLLPTGSSHLVLLLCRAAQKTPNLAITPLLLTWTSMVAGLITKQQRKMKEQWQNSEETEN